MRYLTIGSCLKDEESYMWDFVKYHRKVGVEHFVFFDRRYNELSKMFENESDIEVIHFPEIEGNIHQEAFGQLIKYNQGKTKWLALIDADQCLVPVKTFDIKEIIKDYEEFASLQINWKAFGSSYYQIKNSGSIYERFTKCAEKDNLYNYPTQFICQPDKCLPIRLEEPHYPLLLNEISVNTNKKEIGDKIVAMNPSKPKIFNVPPLHDILYVNHYTNKSKEEWLIKNSKGRADILGVKIDSTQFDEYDKFCNLDIDTRALEIWNK